MKASIIACRRPLLLIMLSVIGISVYFVVFANTYYSVWTLISNVDFKRTVARLVDFPEVKQITSTYSDKMKTTHLILFYKPPSWIVAKNVDQDLRKCVFRNCRASDDVTQIYNSSAVVFTNTVEKYPPIQPSERPINQTWVFHSMESPIHIWNRNGLISNRWMNVMNWSMTYRFDSDIITPYGYLRTRKTPDAIDYNSIFNRKTKFAAWLVSNCGTGSGRDDYVNELRRHGISVDIYGKCGDMGEIDHASRTDLLNTDYKFYFAFENSICNDYITEKFFLYYNFDIVLVVRGGANYTELLPSGTFIDTSNFSSPAKLAQYLLEVNSSRALYTGYLRNKSWYEALYFSPYCSLCETLNNAEEHKNTYADISSYIYHKSYSCSQPTDIPNYHIHKYQYFYAFGFAIIIVLMLKRLCRRYKT